MKISEEMMNLGNNAKKAARHLRFLSSENKNEALGVISANILQNKAKILEENRKDMQFGVDKCLPDSMLDRLYIDESRLEGIIKSLESIIKLRDPVGSLIEEFLRPN